MLANLYPIFVDAAVPQIFVPHRASESHWVEVTTNVGIAAAHLAILVVLMTALQGRKSRQFRVVLWFFALFTGFRALTQLLGIWTDLHPSFELNWGFRLVTTLLALATALALAGSIPAFRRLPSVDDLNREIAERRRAEDEARDKDERFRTYVEGVQDYAIFMIDLEGRIQTWNRGAERIKGYAAEEIIGQHLSVFYSPEQVREGEPERAMRVAIETGQFDIEGWRVRKDGSQFWARVMLRPSRDASGNLRGFAKITRDMTEQLASEARYQILLESMPDAIVIVTEDERIDLINAQAEQLFGYKRAEVVGKPVDMLVPGENRESQSNYVKVLFAGAVHPAPELPGEVRGLCRDGRSFPLEFSVSPLETAAGRLLLFAVRDLTEQRRTEERFRALMEAAPDAIVMYSNSGRIVYFNQRAEEMFGFPRSEVLGKSVECIVPERFREERRRLREELFRTAKLVGMGAGREYLCLRKDGSEFFAEASVSPVASPDGPLLLTAIRDITERKESEARFDALLEVAPDGIIIHDSQGVIQLSNKRMETMFGYSRSELLGSQVFALLPERNRMGQREGLTHYLAASEDFQINSVEIEGLRKDGTEFPFEISVSRFETKNGTMVLTMGRDVSQRKTTETQFRALIEAVPDGIVILDRTSRILLVNQRMEDLFGYRRAELIGMDSTMLVPEQLRATQRSRHEQFFRDPESFSLQHDGEASGLRKDGSTFFVEANFRPYPSSEGLVALVSIRDVTDRRRVEARFRALLDSAPDAMVISGVDGLIQLANLEAERVFGYSREELIGKPVETLIMPDLHGSYQVDAERFFRGAPPETIGSGMELRARRKDGSEFPVEIRFSPLDGPQGTCLTAAIRDTTERRRTVEQLAAKLAELRHSNEALEQFAHMASHDLQEPLRMVASYTQLLAKRYKGRLDADADDFIGFAIDGTRRMKQLIEDLLMYSRAGKGAPPKQLTRSGDALNEALSNLQAALGESRAEITHGPMPTLVTAESQLVQIFQNLIGNAIKYRGVEPPRIDIEARLAESEWIFSVRDNGIGIDPESFDRIFVIFQRLHGRGEFEGTGVGLAICKRILQQQGGRIWLESEPGKGSTFYFSQPVR